MKCTACNKELLKKETVFTEDKEPYCNNPFTCNELHPNSVDNIVARGGAIKMYSEDELDSVIFSNLHVSEEMKDRIMKVATKPQSIRLSKIDIAYYLVNLQEKKSMSSLSEAIRYCVGIAMKVDEADFYAEPEVQTLVEQAKPEGIVAKVADLVTVEHVAKESPKEGEPKESTNEGEAEPEVREKTPERMTF